MDRLSGGYSTTCRSLRGNAGAVAPDRAHGGRRGQATAADTLSTAPILGLPSLDLDSAVGDAPVVTRQAQSYRHP